MSKKRKAGQTVINVNEQPNGTVINPNAINDVGNVKVQQGINATVVNTEASERNTLSEGDIVCGQYVIGKRLDVVSGEADLYICQNGKQQYVAKIYRRKIAVKPEVTQKLKNLKSKCVATIYATGNYNDYPVEILPYYKKGSLEGKTFKFEELERRIIPQLNEGLHALHRAGIIHKDLKPSNIMLRDDGNIAIIDFGISSIRDGGSTVIVTKTGMTPEYSAPEALRNLFLEESDYYSMGVTLYELFTGHTPYGTLTQEEMERYLLVQSFPFPEKMPEDLVKLIKALTYNDITHRHDKSNTNRRWTYDEVLNWCNGISQNIPGESGVPIGTKIASYRFNGKEYTNMHDLVIALASNWEEGKKQLYRGLLSGFFKSSNPEIAGYCMDAEMNAGYGEDEDVIFFKTLYKLDDGVDEFFWKGTLFPTLQELGIELLSTLRNNELAGVEYAIDLLKGQVLSEYVNIVYEKSENNKAISDIERLYSMHKSDKDKWPYISYLLAFLLSNNHSFKFENLEFSDVSGLAAFLNDTRKRNKKRFEDMCGTLVPKFGILQPEFEAWLDITGNSQAVSEWKQELK